MKNNGIFSRVYCGICISADIIILTLLFGMGIYGIKDRADLYILVPLIVTFFLLLSISAFSLIKVFKKKNGKTLRNSVLIKLTVLFAGLAFSFLKIEDGIYPFSFLLFLSIIFAVITVLTNFAPHIKNSRSVKFSPEKPKYSFEYKGKWVWDDAAKEYMSLHDIDDVSKLTDEDGDKIYDYTAGPLSYFFFWLWKSGFLTEYFYGDCPAEMIEDMKNRKVTPVDILGAIDYYFSDEYMSEDILPFFSTYYDIGGYFFSTNVYLYDYYDCIGNPENKYYCIDFSWDILDRLTEKIDERYRKYKNEKQLYPDYDYYEDEPEQTKVNSAVFGELEVCKSGVKYKGEFPDCYIEQCIHVLDTLSPLQIRKLERSFDDDYGYDEDEPISVKQFEAETLHIMEPQTHGDVVFAVSGSADFEPEHGISFSVRNGIITGYGYSYDFDDPYSESNCKNYDIPNIDFTAISKESDAEKYISSGELVKTKLLPDIKGCKLTADEEYVYLTPKALEEKNRCDRFIKDIIAYTGRSDLEILYSVNYQVGRDNKRESIVPRNIFIRSVKEKDWVHISLHLNIWY